MPTFPSSPLKSRTVSFPQSGFKAGLSDDAFPLRISSGLPSSFVHLATAQCPRAVSRTAAHQYTTVQAISAALLYPRGPRSRRVMLSRPSTLIDPMRPARQHTPISPHRLIRNAIAVCPTATPQQPASGSVLSLYVPSQHAALYDLGESIECMRSVLAQWHRPCATSQPARHSQVPRHPLQTGGLFRGFTTVRSRYGLLSCSPPWRIRPGFRPAPGAFTLELPIELVTLLVVEYSYGGV